MNFHLWQLRIHRVHDTEVTIMVMHCSKCRANQYVSAVALASECSEKPYDFLTG